MTEKQEAPAKKRRRRAAEVEQLVAEFVGRGMKQREFCQSRGLALSTLQRYLNRNGRKPGTAAGKNRLVAVEVTSGRSQQVAADCGLALVLGRGRKIEVHPSFDVLTLKRLVEVLERM